MEIFKNNTDPYKNYNDGRMKHLEILQYVISRMGSNSFSIKGWTVVLFSGFMIFFFKEVDKYFWYSPLLLLVIISAWAFDSYFLRLERGFRKQYDSVARMESTCLPFEIKPILSDTFWKVFFSKSLLAFYITLIIVFAIFLFVYLLTNFSIQFEPKV